MTNDNSTDRPLPGDPARQAVPSLRGYAYQIWRTIEQWLRLTPNETLFIECAEDMDIASAHGTTVVQVKASQAKISLASKDAREAVLNFWQLRQRSSGNVRFQFLTCAAIATEHGDHLRRRPGIEVWREAAAGDTESCELLRTFLLERFQGKQEFISYLRSQTSKQLIEEFFSVFEWVTEEPDAEVIKEFIRRRLIEHGDQNGCSPTISAGVLNDLYKHCWEVAQRTKPDARSLARADFLFIFETATTVPVPLSVLANAFAQTNRAMGPVPLTGSISFWTEGVPPLPEPTLPREPAVAEAIGSLSPMAPLVLAGSAGKGKTTLAKLVALATHKECLWIDLSGRDSIFTEAALARLALALEDRAHSFLVVIDDFLVEPNTPQSVLTGFAMIQRACRNSGSLSLVTTKGIPQERLDARLVSVGANIQQIENLLSDEVKEFLERLGCPIALSPTWATLTLAQTGGHPKLVHVRALDLRDQGWPNPTIEGFTETPASIAGQREIERLNVAERESGPRLEFLYHLTLLSLPFDRDFALRLGAKIEGLTDPGTVLDSFLGRWIEPSVASCFHVTSLLTKEAINVWPENRVQEAHARIFDAFLEKRLDVTYVLSVLLHAYLSQSPGRLALYVKGLLDVKDVAFPVIAKELKLVVYFGSGTGNRAIPFSPAVSLVFRHLQFRVASREAPEDLSRLADEWLWEVEQLSVEEVPGADEYLRLSKTLWAGSVASTTEGTLPPETVLEAIIALDAFSAVGEISAPSDALKRVAGSSDMIAVLFSFFQIRCTNVDYLERLLDALVAVPAPLRSRMLAAARLPHLAPYGFLVESAWVREFKKESPNWTKVIRVLERTKTLANEWGEIDLGLRAVKALSIVIDEHLSNREAAIATLDEGRMLFGDAALLDEQLANIQYRHGAYAAALTMWEKALAIKETTDAGQVRDPFAFRKAAIAAGKAGDFRRAAGLLRRGSYWAKDGEMEQTASALLFDAAYAFYRAGQLDKMCVVLREGIDGLIGRPDPQAEFQRFALQKLAGHVVLWMRNEIIGEDENRQAEPWLGCCSNPDYDSRIKELPRTPAEATVTNVIDIEHRLGVRLDTIGVFVSIVRASRMPGLEAKLAFIELAEVYRQGRFRVLLSALDGVEASVERARAQQRLQQNVFEAFEGQVEPEDRIQLGTEYFLLCALGAEVLSGGSGDSLIGTWRELSETAHSGAYTDAINKLVNAIASTSKNASYVLRDASEAPFLRVVAAHVILTSSEAAPELSAYAQAAYIAWLCTSDVKLALREVLPILSASFAKRWEHHLSQTALLINPRLTVPDIQAALAYRPDGAGRIRQILIAVSAATRVRVPLETLEWLHDMDANPLEPR